MPSLSLEAVRHWKNRLKNCAIARFRHIVTTSKPLVTMHVGADELLQKCGCYECGRGGSGARQGSCRLGHAANG